MKVLTIIIILTLFSTSACTITRLPGDYTNRDEFYASINKQSESSVANITLNNQQEVAGRNLRVFPDSSSWTNNDSISIQKMPTSAINKILFKHHKRGMISGGIFGTAGGTLIAIGIFKLTEGDKDNLEAGNVVPVFVGVGCIAAGAIAGAIIGYNKADRHVYILNPEK
jgi:hypothetical protein